VLGPLDPQVGLGGQTPPMPAPSIVKVAREKGEKAGDQFLVLADIAEKSMREMREVITELLRARELGLNVKTEIPPEIYELMDLYPQAQQRRPGVEYVPLPIERGDRPSNP